MTIFLCYINSVRKWGLVNMAHLRQWAMFIWYWCPIRWKGAFQDISFFFPILSFTSLSFTSSSLRVIFVWVEAILMKRFDNIDLLLNHIQHPSSQYHPNKLLIMHIIAAITTSFQNIIVKKSEPTHMSHAMMRQTK